MNFYCLNLRFDYFLSSIEVVPSDDIVEIAVDKTNDKEIYVLMKSGSLNVWNIEEHKIIQTFNLIRKMYKRI